MSIKLKGNNESTFAQNIKTAKQVEVTDGIKFGDGTVQITAATGGGGGGGTVINYNGASAWVLADGQGATLQDARVINGYNVRQVERTGIGSYLVRFQTNLANDTYAVAGSTVGNVVIGNRYIDRFEVFTDDSDGNRVDVVNFSVTVDSSNAIAPQSGVGADAWGRTSVAGALKTGFNIASVSLANTNKFTYTFTTPMPTADYSVTALCVTGGNAVLESQTTTGFVLNTYLDGNPSASGHSVVIHASSTVTPTFTWTRQGTTLLPANAGDDVSIGDWYKGTAEYSARLGGAGNKFRADSASKVIADFFGGSGNFSLYGTVLRITGSQLQIGGKDAGGGTDGWNAKITRDGYIRVGGTLTEATTDPNIELNPDGRITLSNIVIAKAYRCRPGIDASEGDNVYNWNWNGPYVEAWIDATKVCSFESGDYVPTTAYFDAENNTLFGSNLEIRLDPDNSANYDSYGEYTGSTLDVKDKLQKADAALTSIKAAATDPNTDLAGLKAAIVAALSNH